ncbi:MAG: efflux RND transporter periplasmic adaptor subunit [Bacteroidetes bacterium]|nr:efflux RND transporter periplasmic adaptor subunit [Bacteroidota bacterium]
MKKNYGETEMKLIGLFLILHLMVFMIGCSDNATEEGTVQEHNETEEHSEVIKISEEVMKEFGIEVKQAGPGVITNHVDLIGEINVEPSRLSHIIPRFPGIVKEVYKTVGENVNQDEVLALIESNESLTTYEVKFLVEGTIIELHMAKGDLVGGEKIGFTVANLDKVWAMLSVYQKDINKIKVGQNAKVSVGSIDTEETGKISYLSPIVDEATRTASARVVLNNRSGKWRPGMFVTAKVYVSETKAPVVIEKTALQTIEEKQVVFVKVEDGFFSQAVKVGKENDDNVEIISGLKAGQQYVSKGAFTLKAEILKESFGGDEH